MKTFILVLGILLSSCARPVIPLTISGIERSESVKVQDLRPEVEKQGENFSLLITNAAYGVSRIADTSLAPSAIRLLQHRAFEKFETTIVPLEVKIYHLVVYLNLQAELRRTTFAGVLGGAIGAIAAGKGTTDFAGTVSSTVDGKVFESLSAEEYKRAFYTEQENPGRGSAQIVYIESEIQGKRVFSKTIASLKTQEGENSRIVALESAIRFHLSQY